MSAASFRFHWDRLRDLIAATGLKPKPWAAANGFDQSQVSRWLNGQTVPTLPLAARLAKKLGVSLDTLVSWEEDESSEA